ncbi:PEP-CTERM sorting domain-containing protein [Geminisphaera colitermitum]|uniref:PEP-CTERM sorting domain-containing protein n=1 Tax=Geminisphaera colitermitum TaxID=1148786 RepID=UPI000158CCED|nr:PEP-CTERM sorting domain-containing protein [Geminisphaera colitermitum]
MNYTTSRALLPRSIPGLFVAGLFTATMLASLHADTITVSDFNNTVRGLTETYIWNNMADNAYYGSNTEMKIGTASGGADIYRGLMTMDLSKVLGLNPSLNGATITNVELTFTVISSTFGTAGDSVQINLHTTQNFNETGANWKYRVGTTTWATVGGNYVSGARVLHGSATVANDAAAGTKVTITGESLTNIVTTAIMNPATAPSLWLLKFDDETLAGTNLLTFATRENAEASLRPVLTVTYTPASSVPEPSTWVMIAGLGALVFCFIGRRLRSRN